MTATCFCYNFIGLEKKKKLILSLLCFPGACKCINARKVAFLRPDVYASVFPRRRLAASQSSGPDGDQRMASQRVSARVFRPPPRTQSPSLPVCRSAE